MLAPPPAAAGRAQNTADAASQPWNRSAPAGGIPERRQPPQPESVVMTGFTEDAPPNVALRGQRGGKRSAVIAIVMLLVLAAAVIGYLTWSRQRAPQPQAVRVHVLSPVPTAVYRWFSGSGSVVDDEARVLAFATPGRLAELVPAGTEFAPSEILGRLSGAAAIETLLAHHRSRVAFYRQMRESMAAAGNQPERRQAELKLADKQRLVAETEASLARLTLRADEPGEVVEALAKVGTPVKAGAPMLRVKTKLLHGDFALDAEERAEAPKLPFCRVEVVGLGPHASNGPEKPAPPAVADSAPAGAQAGPRFVDCRLGASPTDARPFRVSLPIDVGLVPGQPLRLARRRYDAVFPLPASAVTADGSDETRAAVWIARRSGTAERRAVVLAERADPALVSDGLQVGEDVIVDAPAGLTDGAPLSVIR